MTSSGVAVPVQPIRADSIDTKRAALEVLCRRGSAQVFAAVSVSMVIARVFVGGFGRGDLAVVALTVAAVGPAEWVIHKFLLHAEVSTWTSRRLGIGAGHRRHHIDPPDLDWLLLAGVDSAIFVTVFGAFTAAWTLPLASWLGVSAIACFLTGWGCAGLALLHYEWVHLLVHTRYRCRTRYYRRLGRNHRLHHFRNEGFWLGVTTNSGDRLLRTYPASKGDVALSDTARTLER